MDKPSNNQPKDKAAGIIRNEPTSETSSDNPEPCTDNSENPTQSFSFQLRYETKLKHAVDALRDKEFNVNGMAFIQVTPTFVEITANSVNSGVIAFLCFHGSLLINFNYNNNPFPDKKMIDLNRFSEILSCAVDGDIISVHHVNGSQQLCFIIGDPSNPDRKFSVELLKMSISFLTVPVITYIAEAIVVGF